MNLLNILNDIAAQAGYTIAAATGTDAANKLRAIRRFNVIKSDIISRYGGKWDANYREGELPLTAVYTTGTVAFTLDSRTVTGTNTAFTSAMKGRQIKGPDGAYYAIASVTNGTTLLLTSAFQGVSASTDTFIWQSDYELSPDVLTIGGFIDYEMQGAMRETWPRNMKDSYTNPSYAAIPEVYTVIGRNPIVSTYTTGTITTTANSNTWTGIGTAWLANIKPGASLVVGAYSYTVKRVNSDTELETYQLAVLAVTGTTYSAACKNVLRIRFQMPTSQRLVSYWYWAKDYPLMNDNDEDWICEMYPKVIIDGVLKYDYADKSDTQRLDRATMAYEDSIKNMKVAIDSAYTGPRTLGYYLPDEARD